MIDTSQELINAMRSRNVTTSARVNILNSPGITTYKYMCNSILPMLIANEYVEDLGYIEENMEAYIFNQINNTITQETGKYAIFEGDGIALDGTMNVMSETNKANEIGYMSNSLSNEQGNFETPIELIFINNFTDTDKFNIVFSKVRNEYAKTIDIIRRVYDEDDPTIYTETTTSITNNTSNVVTVDNFSGGFIKIKIYDWNVANTRAKICDMYYGTLTQFEDEKIVSLTARKGTDLVNDSIESKELTLTLLDEESEYNIFEPSGTFANLNKNARVSVELGVLIGDFIYYVEVDEFILTNPQKQDNELEITLTGIGRITQCADSDFLACYYEKDTLKNTLDGYAGYEDGNYFKVDSELELEALEIRTPYGDCSFTDGIRKLAIACRSNVYETIDNEIVFKRIEETQTPVATIELENMENLPAINKEEKPLSIKMTVYTPKITQNNTTLIETDVFELTKDLFVFKYAGIEHSFAPYTATAYYMWLNPDTNEWEVIHFQDGTEFSIDITNNVYCQDNKCIFPGYNETGEHIKIIVKGNKVELVQSSITYTIENGSSTVENSIDTQSIETQEQAKAVCDWLKINYNKCFKYEINVNDAFTYELGDTVEVETGIYVNNIMMKRKAIVVGIEYEYAGALEYKLILKGA